MKKLMTVFLAMAFLFGASVIPAISGVPDKWQGYLVDRQCAESVKEDNDPKLFIENHTKDCALMPNCKAKGYSIYVGYAGNSKWFDLDKKGNELAVKLLQASKRRSGFYVEVTGTEQNKVLKTQSIKEIDEPKSTSTK